MFKLNKPLLVQGAVRDARKNNVDLSKNVQNVKILIFFLQQRNLIMVHRMPFCSHWRRDPQPQVSLYAALPFHTLIRNTALSHRCRFDH